MPRRDISNLVFNGDFEYAPPFTAATNVGTRWIDGTASGSTKDDSPYKWFVLSSSINTFTAQFDTSVYRSGTASLKLSTTNATGIVNASIGSNASRQTFERTTISALPNTTYTITGWIKTNNAATNAAYFEVIEYSGNAANQAANSTSKLSGTNDWTQLTKTFTTTANTRYLLVICRNNVAGNVSDVWYDDIVLTQTTPQTRTVSTVPRKTTSNLLFNGDFEYAPPFTAATTSITKWIDGTAGGSSATESKYGWWTPSSFVASAEAKYDTTVSHSGTTSLKLSTLNATGVANALSGSNLNLQAVQKTAIPILPNTTYTLTGWAKTNNVNTNSVYMDALEYTGNIGSSIANSTSKLSGTNDWTQLTKTFTTNANSRYLFVVLRNAVAGNVSDAWFDDITLTTTAPYPIRRGISNLLTNGDFESAPAFTAAQTIAGAWIDGTSTGTSNQAYGWAVAQSGLGGSASVNYDSTVSHSGTTSLKLSALNTSGTAVVSTSLTSAPTAVEANTTLIKALPSTSYTLTAWAKTNNVGTGGVYADIRQFTGARTAISTTQTNALSGTNDWTKLTLTLTTDSTTRYIGILLRNAQAGTISDAWFDDISLVKNPEQTRTVVT